MKRDELEKLQTDTKRADGYVYVRADKMQELLRDSVKLEAIIAAARSVLSEDGVKERLSAYVMGVVLIDLSRRSNEP